MKADRDFSLNAERILSHASALRVVDANTGNKIELNIGFDTATPVVITFRLKCAFASMDVAAADRVGDSADPFRERTMEKMERTLEEAASDLSS
jgi:hypothetical protein